MNHLRARQVASSLSLSDEVCKICALQALSVLVLPFEPRRVHRPWFSERARMFGGEVETGEVRARSEADLMGLEQVGVLF